MRKIAMRCTQEQFESIKDRIKCEVRSLDDFKKYPYLINDSFDRVTNLATTIANKNREIYETFDAEIFLRACDSWEDEVKYEYFTMGEWYEVRYPIRIKPQPNYTKEIEALQLKAKENGMKCVINFEKI